MTRNPAANLPRGRNANVPADIDELRQRPAVQAVYAGMTLSEAAEACGVSKPTLAQWVAKVRSAYGDEGLPDAFVRRSKLMRKQADTPRSYPIYSRVPGGSFNGCATAELEPTGEYLTDLQVRRRDGMPAPFAMEVRGHSMTNPASAVQFPDGSRVLCDPAQPPDLGDYVVVVDVTDESLTLKRLVNKGVPPVRDLWLEPLNPEYPAMKYEDHQHQVAGVVVDAQMPLYRKPSKTGRR